MLKQLGGHKVSKQKKMTSWPPGGLQMEKNTTWWPLGYPSQSSVKTIWWPLGFQTKEKKPA